MKDTLSIVVLALLVTGCGESSPDKTEKFVGQLRSSADVKLQLHLGGQHFERRLSPIEIGKLCQLITDARPDDSGRKYSTLGEIQVQLGDESKGRPLLFISELEACLILEDGTHLRKIDLNELKELVGEAHRRAVPD